MTCTDTAYIPDLSVIISSVMHALTKYFYMPSDKESLVLNKNATILKFEEHLDHGNDNGCYWSKRLYAIPNDTGKKYLEEKKSKGEILTKSEGT